MTMTGKWMVLDISTFAWVAIWLWGKIQGHRTTDTWWFSDDLSFIYPFWVCLTETCIRCYHRQWTLPIEFHRYLFEIIGSCSESIFHEQTLWSCANQQKEATIFKDQVHYMYIYIYVYTYKVKISQFDGYIWIMWYVVLLNGIQYICGILC